MGNVVTERATCTIFKGLISTYPCYFAGVAVAVSLLFGASCCPALKLLRWEFLGVKEQRAFGRKNCLQAHSSKCALCCTEQVVRAEGDRSLSGRPYVVRASPEACYYYNSDSRHLSTAALLRVTTFWGRSEQENIFVDPGEKDDLPEVFDGKGGGGMGVWGRLPGVDPAARILPPCSDL